MIAAEQLTIMLSPAPAIAHHVPDHSYLTRLLHESIGGRNKTCVMATVTHAYRSDEETLYTLDYA